MSTTDAGDARGPAQGRSDAGTAREQYRRVAPGYDRHMRRFARWQRMAVEHLELRPDDVVIDVACGTGLNFGLRHAPLALGGVYVAWGLIGAGDRRSADDG